MTNHRPLSDLINHPVKLLDDENRWKGTVVDATDEKVKVEWPDESRQWFHGKDVTVDV